MQERREECLYYYCDDRFQQGHKCSRPRLYLLDGLELEAEDDEPEGALVIIQST